MLPINKILKKDLKHPKLRTRLGVGLHRTNCKISGGDTPKLAKQ